MAQTIRPQAFARFTSSAYRRSPAHSEWDPAVLKVLVDLLHDHRVVVEVDAFTGHAVEAVVVGWKDSTRHSNYPHVSLKDAHGATTNYRVSSIGVIMDLDDSDARWQAEKQLHDLTGAAIQQVRRFLGADWVSLEGEGEARWETRLSTGGTVQVLAARTEGEYEGVPFAHWYVDGETVRPGARAARLLSCGQMKLHRHEG